MLAAGRLLHQPPQPLNGANYNCPPSLSNSTTGGSSSVLPAAGVPNLFSQLSPAARRDSHKGSDKDGAALLFDNKCLDEGDCLSVPSNVRKEAESSALFHEQQY
jgi:hypothetical protein